MILFIIWGAFQKKFVFLHILIKMSLKRTRWLPGPTELVSSTTRGTLRRRRKLQSSTTKLARASLVVGALKSRNERVWWSDEFGGRIEFSKSVIFSKVSCLKYTLKPQKNQPAAGKFPSGRVWWSKSTSSKWSTARVWWSMTVACSVSAVLFCNASVRERCRKDNNQSCSNCND